MAMMGDSSRELTACHESVHRRQGYACSFSREQVFLAVEAQSRVLRDQQKSFYTEGVFL